MPPRSRRHILLAGAVGVLALSSFFLLGGDDSRSLLRHDEWDGADQESDVFPYSHPEELEHRSLRATTSNDNLESDAVTSATLTVYLARTPQPNPGYSIFHTDVLQKFGTGRLDVKLEPHAPCDPSACNAELPFITNDAEEGPCLAVANWMYCKDEALRCNYPRCQTMVTNDEKCAIAGADVRGYYTSALPDKGYLPLGPRLDAWTSLQKIQSRPGWRMLPASERGYAFNAVFSQSTHPVRAELAGHIEAVEETRRLSEGDSRRLSVFSTMAKKWNAKVNSPKTEQLNTDRYTEVMLDSVFTLAPAGHNPECYRLFEIVDAGSIPVMVRGDLEGGSTGARGRTGCQDSLEEWKDAPLLVLEEWSELYPTVEKLMQDKAALDERQADMRTWYHNYMKRMVEQFEDYMLDPEGTVVRWQEQREAKEAERVRIEAWKEDKARHARHLEHRKYRVAAWERRMGRAWTGPGLPVHKK